MGSQKDAFLAAEADAWFARNRAGGESASLSSDVASMLRRAGAAPSKLLEIGCSNGQLLASTCAGLACAGVGIDPSPAAIAHGREHFPALRLEVGTADRLPFPDGEFDVVVFGFCLYLCDRADLFRIAAEADRVLADPGWLAITDFQPPFAYRNRYAHRENLHSYKMDYSRLFAWNPAYGERLRELRVHGGEGDAPDARMGTVLLRKDGASAWPLEPFGR